MTLQLIEMDQSTKVARAFDQIADVFDGQFENEITAMLRRRIYHTVESLLPQGGSILDINCGTGIDAAYFASRGFRVTGVDISAEMIRVAKQTHGRNEGPNFMVGSFENLSGILSEPFDLIFSNFGGLNCVQRLDIVGKQIAHVLCRDGYFVAMVMPSFSLWEFFSFALRGNFSSALRRVGSRAEASGFAGEGFDVYYHSPSRLSKAFHPWFQTMDVYGVSIFSPTPQSIGFVKSFPTVRDLLVKVDKTIGNLPFFRSIGDHYVVTLQKHPRME